MILSCQNISKAFGTEEILDNISFHIEEHEKAAVVGINGAGKSTLLKIITGQLAADRGQAVLARGKTLGYLDQISKVTEGNTIYDEVLEAKKEIVNIYRQMKELEIQISQADEAHAQALMNTYARLTHAYEDANGYAIDSEVTGVLTGLGFSKEEFQTKVDTLSGGQRTRVALGKLLLAKPDLILLDEPTNHLDMTSVAWLEGFLKTYKGAVIIVAHDRYFLDKIVTKVIEIENHKCRVYEGNYTVYAAKKTQLRDAARKAWQNQQREIRHQEEVITKLKSFNREKSIKRAESREKLLARTERLEKPADLQDTMRLTLTPQFPSGRDVLYAEGLSKTFGTNTLFSDIAIDIKREEKVALIGKNGTGKTTILKIINGLLKPDTGRVTLGAKVSIGYYDQEHQQLRPEKTIFEEIQDTYPKLDHTRIRNVLAAFLFTGEDVFKRIQDLSGGEQGRVSLAKLMLSDANFLILDEPTNHLDIVSREILEEALRSYTGTVLYVSHDRYFINTTATRILDLTEHTLRNYPGNYDHYLEKKDHPSIGGTVAGFGGSDRAGNKNRGQTGLKTGSQMDSQIRGQADRPAAPQNRPQAAGAVRSGGMSGSMDDGLRGNGDTLVREGKADYRRQKEEAARQRKRLNDLARIEKRIDEIDARMAALDERLTLEEVYTNPQELTRISEEKDTLEVELLELMERWEALEDS